MIIKKTTISVNYMDTDIMDCGSRVCTWRMNSRENLNTVNDVEMAMTHMRYRTTKS